MPDSEKEKENTSVAHKTIKLYTNFMDYMFALDVPKAKDQYKPWEVRQHIYPHSADPIVHGEQPWVNYNFRYVTPVINMPFTDLFACVSTVTNTPCQKLEIEAMECIEYYGAKRGLDICKDYYDDYMECTYRAKQQLREQAIVRVRNKRYNEYLLGKREWSTVYAPVPTPHAFKDPSLTPHTSYKDH
jgi:hypothetical protein